MECWKHNVYFCHYRDFLCHGIPCSGHAFRSHICTYHLRCPSCSGPYGLNHSTILLWTYDHGYPEQRWACFFLNLTYLPMSDYTDFISIDTWKTINCWKNFLGGKRVRVWVFWKHLSKIIFSLKITFSYIYFTIIFGPNLKGWLHIDCQYL